MEWTDSDFFALSRNTKQIVHHDLEGNALDDYFDFRVHNHVIYAIARNVCWTNPMQHAPTTPPVVLEIGVRHGISTLAFLHAMRETGGLLLSVDCDESASLATFSRVEAYGLNPWWKLFIMTSDAFVPLAPEWIDVLLIDGDHRYEQVSRDIANYAPRVRRNGFLFLHDYWSDVNCALPPLAGSHCSEVSMAVDEWLRGGENKDWEVLHLPWSFGLTICRRVA